MKTSKLLMLVALISIMIISCSKEEITTDIDVSTEANVIEDTSKSRAQIGISLLGTTAVCDRLGSRIEVHLQYIGTATYNYTVYVDVFEADGITLIDTWDVNNYNDQSQLDVTIGNPNNHKCCSILDPGTDYLIRIRYNTTVANLQPTATELDYFCTLGGIIG
ncbi:MAG: hypothetical protein ACI9Y7_002801 [Dokdonia sp.]|jgi:hypothetical protein